MKVGEIMYAEKLSDFLNFLRTAQETYDIALDGEAEKELETQDILHKLELETVAYHEKAKLAALLATVRQERRKYKNTYQALQPLIDWMNNNTAEINKLKQTLGEMRKIESKQATAYYLPKTNILDNLGGTKKNET